MAENGRNGKGASHAKHDPKQSVSTHPSMVERGRKGGLARVANQKPWERSVSAHYAALARWRRSPG
jgi:hypothetical protein